MQKRWTIKETNDKATVANLAAALSIEPTLADILVQRGVNTFDEARYFFRPVLEHLHDPFLMRDMELAIARIDQAIARQERILIYGDYDVDGTTAVALVYSFFSKRYNHLEYYIPDRYLEGYGISTKGIDYAAANGFSLIIALDCGIKSVDKIAYANTLGVDFIICDHHLAGEEIPAAAAVLDPKRPGCEYPYKELSGCGIGFKLIQAYAQAHDIPFEEVTEYLDLVAISVACDIVHINGENRVLAYYGLQKINNNPCVGVRALMGVAGRSGAYTITDVVFQLGPRINAAGRIDDAKHAVELLIACHDDDAQTMGTLINLKNLERKEHDTNITGDALSMIDNDAILINRKSTVVFNEGWHKGVIGIVASRLTEKYYRPTVVLTRSNGHVAGSARSVRGYDLYEALCGCADLLIQFGGHKYAAGLTLEPENIEAFTERFEQIVSSTIAPELLIPEILIDAEVDFKQIDAKFFRILQQLAPFGPENMSPTLLTRNVKVRGAASLVGQHHLKMVLEQPDAPVFEAIAFGQGEMLDQVNSGQLFDVCYHIEENVWRDKRTVQLNIKGIRFSE
ncbi:exonuclease RecJ [Mucilaginibacter yixingensis]|uniref:Single-stranded-DNA-specific exonuclease RecJ n=1 Tax=Mucilaginibacter yixingensis TaxID=1295612 RepID=A0A2T5JD03_9SPHI|nr:single-stranded-DNA-specific exonuclease RecJ [Mucilaginibacter yixingensis]PTQ99545.1 exonuclease RecJ [Mucilaginibacter yixingensis]